MVPQWRFLTICLVALLGLQIVVASPMLRVGAEKKEKQKPATPSQGLHGSLPQPMPAPLLTPSTVSKKKIPTSYSGKSQTSSNAATSAEKGFEAMSKLHGHQDNKPGIVSALKTPDGKTYLDSSKKGGLPASSGRDPSHISTQQTKDIYQACKEAHGGNHGTGGNCGEINNANSYFKANPGAKQIPSSSEWQSHGHFGMQTETHQPVPPCMGGTHGTWGCKQFMDMAKTPVDQRPAKIDALRAGWGGDPLYASQKPKPEPQPQKSEPEAPSTPKISDTKRKTESRPDPPKPSTTDADGRKEVTKKEGNGKRWLRDEMENDLLLSILQTRSFLDLI